MTRRIALLAVSLPLLAGCATKSDVSSLEASMLEEMREFQTQQGALLEQIALAFDSLDALERRVINERGEAQRRFDSVEDRLDQLFALLSQINQQLTEMRAGRASGPSEAAPAGAGETGGALPRSPSGDEASLFYSAAQQQLTRGSYGTARGGFQDFLENYPDHRLAPDAQFYLAETYALENDSESALDEYERVWELWPDSRRAPTALFKAGFLELGRANVSEARRLFERVTLGYPNSPEAELAEEQLKTIRP